MSSAFDTRFAAAALPALMDEHGQAVEQWPRGSEGAKRSVDAMWSPDLSPERDASQDGERTTLGGSLQVAESVDCHGEDVWVIDEERYATLTVSEAHGGVRTVTVTRVDRFSTSRHRTKL